MKIYRRGMSLMLTAIVSICCILGSAESTFAYSNRDEMEPNNAKWEANYINMGTTVYGVSDEYDYLSGTGNGEDWFRFTAPVSGTVYVSVHTDSTWRDSEKALIDVYDSENDHIAEVADSMYTDGGEKVTFGVRSGRTYYLRVSGDYYGFYAENVAYHFSVGYSIGKTSVNSVSGKKKGFTVRWSKKSGASFYQVQYVKKGTYQNYGWSGAKTVKVSSGNGSKTIKKLSRNKRYYVRVRVGRTINGITYYSGWSNKVSVKTR